MIAIDLCKQEALDANPKAENWFDGKFRPTSNNIFYYWKSKRNFFIFSHRTVKVFLFYFLIWYKVTQYNTLNVHLSNWQLNELKSGIKSGPIVTLTLSSDAVGDSNDENNFPHQFVLTNTVLIRFRSITKLL